MGFFGEKYSRQSYEKTEEDLKSMQKGPSAELTMWLNGQGADVMKMEKERWEAIKKAKSKLQSLLESGHKEASALNKEHDRLLAQVSEAQKAVANFERDKLGVNDSTDNESQS